MPNIFKPSFAGGEVAPSMYARFDVAKQQIALKTCRNSLVRPQGGVENRPGTKFITEVQDSSKIHRLIPFQFSTEQAYVLEFGDLTIRVIKDGILAPFDIVDAAYKWTLSAFGTGEYHLELAAGGDPGIALPTELRQNTIRILKGTLGSLNQSEWGYGDNDALGYNTPYVRIFDSTDPDLQAQGFLQIPLILVTPYSETDLVDIKFAQSADTMYIVHPDHGPRKLTRTSHVDWTLGSVPIGDGPYSGSKASDLENIFTSNWYYKVISDLVVSSKEPMVGAEVGKPIRLGFENPLNPSELSWGWGEITEVTDSTNIRVDVDLDNAFGFDLITNSQFKSGIDFWQDRATSPSTITHDLAAEQAVLTKVGANEVSFDQPITVINREQYNLEIDVHQVDTGVNLQVGTDQGLSDILNTTITVPGRTNYDIKALGGTTVNPTIWVRLWTQGFAAGVTKVNRIHVRRRNISTPYWRIGAFGFGTGMPKNVGFFEQRLVFMGTDSEPDTAWLSKTGDFENFAFETPINANDAFSFVMNSQQVNAINWFTSLSSLVIGTTGEEWRVSGGGGSEAISPLSILARPQSKSGSSFIQPIIINNTVMFVQRGGSAIRSLDYSLESDGYNSSDLTILAEHLFRDKQVSEWAYTRYPNSVVWVVQNDGALLGLSYFKEHDIIAWHRHDTINGAFKSVCVLTEPANDDVYTIVEREIDGSTKKYIEKIMPRITDEEIYDYFFVDSGLSYNNPLTITNATQTDPVVVTSTSHGLSNGDFVRIAKIEGMTELNGNLYKVANVTANTVELTNYETDADIDGTGFGAYVSGGEMRKAEDEFYGLDHLLGETVSVLADGSIIKDKVVTDFGSGNIGVQVDLPAGLVHIGLPIEADIVTLDLETATEGGGISVGKTKSVLWASVYFEKTRTAEIGTSFDNLTEWVLTDEGDSDSPTPLFTGVQRRILSGGHQRQHNLVLRHTDPTPITLLAVIPEVKIRAK